MPAYQDLDSIHRPSTSAVAPAAWGDGVNDNFAFLASSDAAITSAGQTTTSTSFTDLATVGPTITLETGTKAIVMITSFLSNNTAGQTNVMGVAVSGASSVAASDGGSLTVYAAAVSAPQRLTFVSFVTGLTAGVNTFTAKYRVTGGTGSFAERRVLVLPLP
jgi:hypothetical protein